MPLVTPCARAGVCWRVQEPPSRVCRQMLQDRHKCCLAEGTAMGHSPHLVALPCTSTASSKRWRAGDVSHHDQILWRVRGGKEVGRLLVSLLTLLGIGSPFLLVLLPALVTPKVSLNAQCCMGLPLWVPPWVQSWAAVASLPLQGYSATGQGTVGLNQRVGIPEADHI